MSWSLSRMLRRLSYFRKMSSIRPEDMMLDPVSVYYPHRYVTQVLHKGSFQTWFTWTVYKLSLVILIFIVTPEMLVPLWTLRFYLELANVWFFSESLEFRWNKIQLWKENLVSCLKAQSSDHPVDNNNDCLQPSVVSTSGISISLSSFNKRKQNGKWHIKCDIIIIHDIYIVSKA